MLFLGVYLGCFCFAPWLKVCSLLRLLGIQDCIPPRVPKLCSGRKSRVAEVPGSGTQLPEGLALWLVVGFLLVRGFNKSL